MKAQTRIRNFSQTSLEILDRAGQSTELKREVANLAQNAPDGSKTAKFTTSLSKALNIAGVAAKLYGLIKPLTVAMK